MQRETSNKKPRQKEDIDSFLEAYTNISNTDSLDDRRKDKGKQEKDASSSGKAYRIDRKTGFLIHEVLADDTLQSLSLQYGVSMFDLKKQNKIMSPNPVFFGTLVIPITEKNYQLLLQSRESEKNKEILQTSAAISEFCAQTQASADTAQTYLAQTGFDLQRAIEKYTIDTIQKAGSKKRSKSYGEKSEQQQETSSLLSSNYGYYHNSFGTRGSVERKKLEVSEPTDIKRLSKREMDRLSQSYNSLFDL